MNELKKVRRAYCVAMRKFQKHQEIDYVLPNNGTIINTSQVKDLQEAERLVTLHIRAVSDMETKIENCRNAGVHHRTPARVMRQLLDDLRQHLTNIQQVYQTWATLSQDVQEKEIAWKAWKLSEPLFVTSVEDILADFQTRTKAYQYASKEQSTTTSTPLLLVAKESKHAENIDDLPVAAATSNGINTSKSSDSLGAPVRIDVDFTAENNGDLVVPAIDLDRVLRIDLTLPEESLVGFNAWGHTRVKYRTLHNLSVYFYDQEEEGQGELLAREAVENGRKELALAKSYVEKGRQQGRLTVQCDNKDTSSPPQYYVETDKTVRNFLEDGTKLPLGKTFKMQVRLSFGVAEYGATKMMIVRGQRSFLREASRRLGDQLPVGRELFR